MLFVLGYPGPVGGACTELWHTLRLWRRYGVEVHLIPTWQADPEWRQRCEAIGCITHEVPEGDREALAAVPGLAGATVVSFCNDRFLLHAGMFRALRCPIVWVGCMNWLFAAERRHYRTHGPFDAYVFQSKYQLRALRPELASFGVAGRQCHLIRGPLELAEFDFRPRSHRPGEPFVLGRLSRAAPDKFSSNTWPIYAAVPYQARRARILGWSRQVESKLGPPPDWAETLAAGSESSERFLASLHCLLHVTGGSRENWPRCGLEAMAAGVPVVAERDFGWTEMIEHGRTGFLGRNDQELAYFTARLAYDEDLRLEMIVAARRRLAEVLAPPDRLWLRWKRLLEDVGQRPRVKGAARPTREAKPCGCGKKAVRQ